MKGLIIGAFVLVGSQAAILGLCTGGQCGASALVPSLLFGAAVVVVARVLSSNR